MIKAFAELSSARLAFDDLLTMWAQTAPLQGPFQKASENIHAALHRLRVEAPSRARFVLAGGLLQPPPAARTVARLWRRANRGLSTALGYCIGSRTSVPSRAFSRTSARLVPFATSIHAPPEVASRWTRDISAVDFNRGALCMFGAGGMRELLRNITIVFREEMQDLFADQL
jgi:hypothetical protein